MRETFFAGMFGGNHQISVPTGRDFLLMATIPSKLGAEIKVNRRFDPQFILLIKYLFSDNERKVALISEPLNF